MSKMYEGSPVVIRSFRPGDFADVVEIDEQVFGDRDPFTYMSLYEVCPGGFKVAEAGQRLVGFIVGFKVNQDVGRIFSVAVRPEWQDRGVGTALLEASFEYMRSESLSRVVLEVRESNHGARRLYQSLGFYEHGRAENYYKDGETAVLMQKEL